MKRLSREERLAALDKEVKDAFEVVQEKNKDIIKPEPGQSEPTVIIKRSQNDGW